MAIAVLIETSGLTQEQYEMAARTFREVGTTLEGPLIHLAGQTEDGYRIIEVWNTQDAANAFYGSELCGRVMSQLPPSTFATWPLQRLDVSGMTTQ
jgi:hypothetical protein